MANYFQPEIEKMPYEQLRQLQNERFMKQIRHVWDNALVFHLLAIVRNMLPDMLHLRYQALILQRAQLIIGHGFNFRLIILCHF